jgi:hypothetical protein
MPITTYDDVVDNFDSEKATRADQIPSDEQVSRRRRHVP